jgi:hypothetical protein
MTKAITRLIAISGAAGSGKSTAADALAARGWVQVAQADPIKRFCAQVFGFSEHQLYGPSEARNALDERYDTAAGWYEAYDRLCEHAQAWLWDLGMWTWPARVSLRQWFESLAHEPLSPRTALQSIGAWGRAMDATLWTRVAVWRARRHLAMGSCVVTPDIRLRSELAAFASEGALTVRIVRPGAGLTGEAGRDQTETEMAGIPDDAFDVVLKNDGTVEDIGRRMVELCYENSDGGEHGA